MPRRSKSTVVWVVRMISLEDSSLLHRSSNCCRAKSASRSIDTSHTIVTERQAPADSLLHCVHGTTITTTTSVPGVGCPACESITDSSVYYADKPVTSPPSLTGCARNNGYRHKSALIRVHSRRSELKSSSGTAVRALQPCSQSTS